jgi:hypothetical protein
MTRLTTAAVAAACGAAAGCLYLAILFGTPSALLLAYMTQLPLFLAGLWLGAGAAALAGITGTLLLFVGNDLDALGAAIFAAINAGPVILLVRQALLARPRRDGTLAWYPPGLLAAWLAALALGGFAAVLLLFGGPQGVQSALRDLLVEVLDRVARRPIANRDQFVEGLAMVIPGIVAASWMIMAIVNGTLAQGVLARFGANWRPSPDLAGLGLPKWLPAALGLAAAAIVFGDGWRFVGINAMIALSVPFCLAGLAVLHAAARRLSHPVMALVAFYTVAALFGWPFVAIAVLGLLESWLGLRYRLASCGVTSDG